MGRRLKPEEVRVVVTGSGDGRTKEEVLMRIKDLILDGARKGIQKYLADNPQSIPHADDQSVSEEDGQECTSLP